ncbi:hypothetical protein NUW54_g1355 [Trametes sanguinea]|uniref:Uncharacterized protein n=1 Tax=Trametes sanguinea TaxID=158606 RepID=A0ACC1Q6K2_9APHY|nr:hypothetical protein NUW54_g1355 [Trametes sanguinea]
MVLSLWMKMISFSTTARMRMRGYRRRINLSHATTEQLQHLADSCDPATLEVEGQDVYDETYRKAGKLDARHFALTCSPASAGLLDVVRDQLFFETMSRTFPRDQTTNIRTELYKLNVYGPQSFFKRHVDTPRDDSMFGSLVIVYPTTHEGGELVLRSHDEGPRRKIWTVDSSSLLSQTNTPSIAPATASRSPTTSTSFPNPTPPRR